MARRFLIFLVISVSGMVAHAGEVVFGVNAGVGAVQVRGSDQEDWRIEGSADLKEWVALTNISVLLSGGLEAPIRTLGSATNNLAYYRAQRTAGLYDNTLLRTISLTFTQANWATLLANARNTGQDVIGGLSMDNGATNGLVGARYKGNTSYSRAGQKKSLNISIDSVNPSSELMGYESLILNNAYADETIMREPLYFSLMSEYAVCPRGSLARLFINGTYWGVYSLTQNEDGDLIKENFPSNDGDRWRAPNIAAGGAGGGSSALMWLGTNVALYRPHYELKKQGNTNAWEILVRAINVLNNTPASSFRDTIEDFFAVDRWIWFLVLENVFADEDSYFYKGADYVLYYEPESGRFHPVERDGNEAFTAADQSLNPLQGQNLSTRPVLSKFLRNAELKQRYLAHMRTVLEETYNPEYMTPLVDRLSRMSYDAIAADTRKGYSMTTYNAELLALKRFVTNRYRYLTNHVDVRLKGPDIVAVSGPSGRLSPTDVPYITASVHSGNGVESVWLYFRPTNFGRFAFRQMYDDGAHQDGDASDGVYGAATTNYPTGTRVRYYVEARAATAARTAKFSPERAEESLYSYAVAAAEHSGSDVLINEVMADNGRTLADPQGEFDDWVEIVNLGESTAEMGGKYLTDDANEPRKWRFPDGTAIEPGGYLLVWCDEDSGDQPGLHANFRLAASGERVLLVDKDEMFNALLDEVTFGEQKTDLSFGRNPEDLSVFEAMPPSPGQLNQKGQALLSSASASLR